MDEAETIEEWAARVAPTLDADGWTALNSGRHVTRLAGAHSWPDEQRALLAYRNKVAAGLSVEGAGYLAWAAGRDRVSYYSKPCLDLGLIVPLGPRASDGWCVTNLGREIARHLGVSNG